METREENRTPDPWLRGSRGAAQRHGTPRFGLGHEDRPRPELLEITNAMVRIYKALLGRGPTRARSDYAGPDTLVATVEQSLTAAERNMIALGGHQRVREMRLVLEYAHERNILETVERITGRKVRAFVSGTDPSHDVSSKVFYFEPGGALGER